jgi:hypothetical protein
MPRSISVRKVVETLRISISILKPCRKSGGWCQDGVAFGQGKLKLGNAVFQAFPFACSSGIAPP